MDEKAKTFEDLQFKPHPRFKELYASSYKGKYLKYTLGWESEPKQAFMRFPNRYCVSVLSGGPFYTEEGTYELAVLLDGRLVYDLPFLKGDVLKNLNEEEVTKVMITVQQLPEPND